MKEAIFLAGGFGTRLSHVVTDTQKVMAPVKGKPFIEYLFDMMLSQGYDTFILAVSYLENTVEEHFGNGYKSARIIYSRETQPLGTGGAIKKALSYCESDCIPVINGDTYFYTDINALTDFHRAHNADITLTVKKTDNCERYGTLSFDTNGKVNGFYEKKATGSGFINGGVYCVNRDIFEVYPEKFSFEKDVLESGKYNLFAFESKGYFIDIGIPSDYFTAQIQIPLLTGDNVFRAVFTDRDGTVNKEINYLHSPDELEFIEGAPQALEKLRENGYLIIVITNQAGVAKGYYTEDDVIALHKYMSDTLADTVRLDAFYYCPFHREATVKKYRCDSPFRKPGTGMIEQAVKDFEKQGIIIDIKNSVFIGDTENDIETGINAGTGKNILVLSGHAKSGDKTKADFTAKALPEAAEFILNN